MFLPKSMAALFITAAIASWSLPPTAVAECACNQHKDRSQLEAQERARVVGFKSQSQLLIARAFDAQKLPTDAEQAYQAASQLADSELTQARLEKSAGRLPSIRYETILAHTSAIQHEAAFYFRQHGDQLAAARQSQAALDNDLELNADNIDLSARYQELATLYEAAGAKPQAVSIYAKLLERTRATKGRYSPEVSAITTKLQLLSAR